MAKKVSDTLAKGTNILVHSDNLAGLIQGTYLIEMAKKSSSKSDRFELFAKPLFCD